MFALSLLLAAGSLSTLIAATPVPSSPLNRHAQRHSHSHGHSLAKRTYNVLGGNGKIAEGWPDHANWWPAFDKMFEANRDTMRQSCAQWDVPNNSDSEIDDISSSIKEVAESSGVDPRFILAIVIQESNGCVRAPTSNYGVSNPGLMQSHNGQGSCNDGTVQNPCPKATIKQMIEDGTVGTADGAGLKGCLEQAGGNDAAAYYAAARIYNSGSVAASGNLGQGIATHCYSSDVANRLTGWSTGPSSCEPNTIGTLDKAVTSIFRFTSSLTDALTGGDDSDSDSDSSSDSSSETQTSQSETTAAAEPTQAATETTTQAPAPTTTQAPTTLATQAATSSSTSTVSVTSTSTAAEVASTTPATSAASSTDSDAPIYPHATSPCQEYYTVTDGDYCLKVESDLGVTPEELTRLNPGLSEDCTNLWLGYQYCVKA